MNPGGKALWFIESPFADDILLGDIAEIAGVSRTTLPTLSRSAASWRRP